LSSGVRKNLNSNDIKEFEVRMPNNISTQQKIAKVLSDLDAKIELNNKINTELEAMAKTLYDYWFVQFDFPDANGKPYKISGRKMVWNAELKREIPEGWEVKELHEVESNIITGKTPSTKDEENFGGDIPFVTIDDIRKQLYVLYADRTLTKKGANSQSNKYLQPGDICVSCIGTIGVIGIIGTICQTNQQINSISNIEDFNRYFLLNAVKDYFNFNIAAKKGAVLDNMNKGDFSLIPILNAPTQLKIEYNKTVHSFYVKIENNLKENQQLASLRDWLLPMLMNGQVRVGDVEEELGMVAEGREEYKK
jgi:type I restriction enzyme S subunit